MGIDTAHAPTNVIAGITAGTVVKPTRPRHIRVLSAPDVRVVVPSYEAEGVMKEHQSPKARLLQRQSGGAHFGRRPGS